jgi:SAM-dependent methyltransferase
MNTVVAWIDRTCYPHFQRNWDDQLFRERILAHMRPASAVLDLGAGAGIVDQMNFRGCAASICGVDLDPRVVNNPMLDEGRIANADGIPYESNRFDVVFSDNVLEHLEEPLSVFREVARVLKPGGVFLFKTPNKWHYMPTIARLTPHGFHQYVNRLRGRAEADTFPTRYRANCVGDITRLAVAAGLMVDRIDRVEGRPEYLRMAWPTYVVGLAYERLVNSSELFAPLRILLVGSLRKPTGHDVSAARKERQ